MPIVAVFERHVRPTTSPDTGRLGHVALVRTFPQPGRAPRLVLLNRN